MKTEIMTKKIAELSADVEVATNSGTFGPHECLRAVGTGDPAFGAWSTYERIDGTRYTIGADPDTAPGYARRLTHDSAASRRAEIKALGSVSSCESEAKTAASHREQLARGWDGYRFVGVDEGAKILATI